MDDRRPACRGRALPTRGWCTPLALALVLACLLSVPSAAKLTVAQKKQIARTAFEDAERMREALNGRPAADRSRRDYQRVIDAYRKVYYTAPNSIKAEPSIIALAELLADEGRTFNDDKPLQAAVGQYEFLRREYPGSKRRVAALYAIGQIYADDLNDTAKARQTFQDFLKHYPGSELADDAKKALAELDSPKKRNAKTDAEPRRVVPQKKTEPTDDAAPAKKEVAKADAPSPSPTPASRADLPPAVRAAAEKADAAVDKLDGKTPKVESKTEAKKTDAPKTESAKDQPAPAETPRRGKLPLVTGIRHWSTPDYTRIAVDLEEDVHYEVGRIPDPDRLFFDLHGTKLAAGLMGKEYEVQDGLLKKVRVAQFLPGETRIVLDLGDIADYQVFLLPNPFRLIVDVHGKKKPAASAKNSAPPSTATTANASAKSTSTAPLPTVDKKPVETVKTTPDIKVPAPTANSTTSNGKPDTTTKDPSPVTLAKADVPRDARPDPTPPAPTAKTVAEKTAAETTAKSAAKTDAKTDDDDDSADAAPAPRTRAESPGKTSRNVIAAREAKPTASGDRSLIRALGLKIGRIVVDAGHGGHDVGTIGPTGLLEKDLVLDVALRLGKLLEARMGSDVVYTRDDDTFIPLETRTAIANREQADLFISVHANSSRDPKARGVETYYLNFTTSADALEVAARENAVSDTSIHELGDLVKKIALKEKVEESREFASDVQASLRTGLSNRNSNMRDRGVKKAPFIVLIGANMPSILAEISFVSNPADEKRLKTPEYRQKIAESLYRGVARYVSGLSGIKVAAAATKTGQ